MSKGAYLDGDTKFERIQGLQPKFEDWHLKDDLFNDGQSGSEFGKEHGQ